MVKVVGNTHTSTSSHGFTIVELLIVIIVIGILAGIILVGYNGAISNANDKSVQADISKLADVVKSNTLDTQSVPAGGITSAGVGTATVFTGIIYKPTNQTAYDLTVSNLYYCEGTLAGNDEYGVAARSKSGKAFSFLSTSGVATFSASVWTVASNGPAVCGALGFTAPFTWSYGFNPTGPLWASWATP